MLPGKESRVVDFSALLLQLLKYHMPKRKQMVHFGHEIPLNMCDETVDAQTELLVTKLYNSDMHYRLLFKQDKVRIVLIYVHLTY